MHELISRLVISSKGLRPLRAIDQREFRLAQGLWDPLLPAVLESSVGEVLPAIKFHESCDKQLLLTDVDVREN